MSTSASVAITVAPAALSVDPLTSALAAVILAACAFHAWRRREFSPAQRAHSRWSRAAISSLTLAGAAAILMMSENRGNNIGDTVATAIVGFILFGLAAFLLICLIELAIWRARASRSRRWLAAAPIIFASAFASLVAGLALQFGPDLSPGWDLLQLLAIAVGASLVWWSYLPAPSTEVGRLFE